MACSKLFSGHLPELSIQIIQNLRNNFNTLYSLALVNRFWCRLAIPLLWEDPFSIKYQKNSSSHFLDTYLLFLSENDKSKLKEIKFYGFERKPLFNYPSLIKTMDISRINLHVANWLRAASYSATSTVFTTSVRDKILTCLQNKPPEYLTRHYDYEKSKDIYIALFNLFIENNASLNSLYYNMNNRVTIQIFNDIYKHCNLSSSKFLSEIEIFSFYDWTDEPNLKPIQTFLSSLPSLSTSIKHIDFSSDKPEINKILANIIQSQLQLSSIKISHPEILDSLKFSSNTLTSITFYARQFSNTMRFDALSCLIQLKSLQFKYCHGLRSSNVIQPLLNITTPLKIKTLVIINHGSDKLIEELIPIKLLIQKIGPYIENLVLSVHNYKLNIKLFGTIIDFCENVKFLYLNNIGSMVIPHLSRMFFKFSNSLKYLTLEVKCLKDFYSGNTSYGKKGLKFSSMILKELSKSLPLSLHYLNLGLIINPDDLQIALENCKQVELKKLLIRNLSNNLDTTLNVIKDFVKEKDLEFLAYYIENNRLVNAGRESLEKLVEEIQPLVKMVCYDELVIRVSEIDGNLIVS